MSFIRLIHWNAEESQQRAAHLRKAGYDVDDTPLDPASLRAVRKDPPRAVVIDLSRLPMQGRDVALAIRQIKATRQVPLIFVDGDEEKKSRVKQSLPDAAYTTWSRIRGSIEKAVANPPKNPLVPRSVMDGYAGTPLTKKLGIKPGSVVVLDGAPDGFENTLGELPESAILKRQSRGGRNLTIWFTTSFKDLERRIDVISSRVDQGGLWIAWPKKSSALAGDITQADVRKVGLAAGLVDYKICAIDETWSGLKFTVRKQK